MVAVITISVLALLAAALIISVISIGVTLD